MAASSSVEKYLRSLLKYFSTREEKFRISVRPCNILYMYVLHNNKDLYVAVIHFTANKNDKSIFAFKNSFWVLICVKCKVSALHIFVCCYWVLLHWFGHNSECFSQGILGRIKSDACCFDIWCHPQFGNWSIWFFPLGEISQKLLHYPSLYCEID